MSSTILRPSRRWCVAEPVKRVSAATVRQELLDGQAVESDFQALLAPVAPRDQTRFKVYRQAERLVVAVAMIDTRPGGGDSAIRDELEIHFDPRGDRLGWVQFVISHDGTTSRETFIPYPEYHRSDYRIPRLVRHEVRDERLDGGVRVRWVLAWFDAREVASDGVACGFNIARSRPALCEHSTWNYAAGNGLQDADGHGDLWLELPSTTVERVTAKLGDDELTLRLEGVRGDAGGIAWGLVDPLGDEHQLEGQRTGEALELRATLPRVAHGRYHVRASMEAATLAPQQWHFDLAPTGEHTFDLSVTADPPMCMIPNHYTPARLCDEMAHWRRWGIERMYWIDYGDGIEWLRNWKHAHQTFRACGDLVTAMAAAAREHDIEPWAVFKPFDLSINLFRRMRSASKRNKDGNGARRQPRDCVYDLENREIPAVRDLVDNPHATMQSDERSPTAPAEPVTALRFFSLAPIPEIKREDVRVLVSDDNVRYRAYRGQWRLNQGEGRRPHCRWTPAGKQRIRGGQRNYRLEVTGLKLTSPYVAVQVRRSDASVPTLSHRLFMLAEALDGDGVEQPITLATGGDTRDGLVFWKTWRSWVNRDEPPLEHVEWPMREIGLALRVMPNQPTMLEPADADAHRIWLERIGRQLDGGVAGVDIRTLCHHNEAPCHLRYAYGPAVRERFESRFGRLPDTTPEDYQRIREIRGEGYTRFLRQASEFVRGRGARLAVHIESGMEIPPYLDTRMQVHWDWSRWVREGIVDEVTLKWFTAQSRFVHEQVLPLCRRHGVPVRLCSRNLGAVFDTRGMEILPRLVRDARAAGFAGYNLYETANLMVMTPTGSMLPKADVATILPAARDVLRDELHEHEPVVLTSKH